MGVSSSDIIACIVKSFKDLTDASSSSHSMRFLLHSPLIKRCIVQNALRIEAQLAP